MASANVVILEGKLSSQVKYGMNTEKNLDQADFYLEVKDEGQTQNILCRVLGKDAFKLKSVKENQIVVLDGRLKYSQKDAKFCYVEAMKVMVYDL